MKLHIWHQIKIKRAEKGSVPMYDAHTPREIWEQRKKVLKYKGYSENWLVPFFPPQSVSLKQRLLQSPFVYLCIYEEFKKFPSYEEMANLC